MSCWLLIRNAAETLSRASRSIQELTAQAKITQSPLKRVIVVQPSANSTFRVSEATAMETNSPPADVGLHGERDYSDRDKRRANKRLHDTRFHN
jgi:hypothetical protein